jgi:hypothetical protein
LYRVDKGQAGSFLPGAMDRTANIALRIAPRLRTVKPAFDAQAHK